VCYAHGRIYADVKGPLVLKDGDKQVIIRADSKWKVIARKCVDTCLSSLGRRGHVQACNLSVFTPKPGAT